MTDMSQHNINSLFDDLKCALIERYEKDLEQKDNFTKQVVIELDEAYDQIERMKIRIKKMIKVISVIRCELDDLELDN